MKEEESYSKAMPTEKYMAALPEFWQAPVVPRALTSFVEQYYSFSLPLKNYFRKFHVSSWTLEQS